MISPIDFQKQLDESHAHYDQTMAVRTLVIPYYYNGVLIGQEPINMQYAICKYDIIDDESWPIIWCRVYDEDKTFSFIGDVILPWFMRN
jgi:hypothetical protein